MEVFYKKTDSELLFTIKLFNCLFDKKFINNYILDFWNFIFINEPLISDSAVSKYTSDLILILDNFTEIDYLKGITIRLDFTTLLLTTIYIS